MNTAPYTLTTEVSVTRESGEEHPLFYVLQHKTTKERIVIFAPTVDAEDRAGQTPEGEVNPFWTTREALHYFHQIVLEHPGKVRWVMPVAEDGRMFGIGPRRRHWVTLHGTSETKSRADGAVCVTTERAYLIDSRPYVGYDEASIATAVQSSLGAKLSTTYLGIQPGSGKGKNDCARHTVQIMESLTNPERRDLASLGPIEDGDRDAMADAERAWRDHCNPSETDHANTTDGDRTEVGGEDGFDFVGDDEVKTQHKIPKNTPNITYKFKTQTSDAATDKKAILTRPPKLSFWQRHKNKILFGLATVAIAGILIAGHMLVPLLVAGIIAKVAGPFVAAGLAKVGALAYSGIMAGFGLASSSILGGIGKGLKKLLGNRKSAKKVDTELANIHGGSTGIMGKGLGGLKPATGEEPRSPSTTATYPSSHAAATDAQQHSRRAESDPPGIGPQ